ncbi:hypothetical protein IEN85_03355 [Pelagicoccus sp. NFK12]|uniref:Glycoside hydrolase family 42 N-terminal domain-containing protein n=1 Tax=Pelagicoccus enzymogenes TaxID=2773457 RepID=A0A927IFW6_9BACT|nr:hypothetical protein [Pelagicoccus enzymogenes]MBD5778516.1 hypothetical protein [Pelagicoccus enzymogenes]
MNTKITRWKLLAAGLVASQLVSSAFSQDTWAFDPEPDDFDPSALFDLRYLNEDLAGQNGWVGTDEKGDFVRGDGEPLRFWAVNTAVARNIPYQPRPRPGWENAPDLDRHARWLAKRGVNLIRLHSHINPHADSQELNDANESELDWIFRSVGSMKQAGVYTIVSPYWANTMESDDSRWGTDWEGGHHGLLFFDTKIQEAYKEWLRKLFTTPSEHLDGKTLAEEPALAMFQIQNEDSLLFWTINNLRAGPKRRLGELFHAWALDKYQSIDAAFDAWGTAYSGNDDIGNGVLGIVNIWDLTGDGKAAHGTTARLDDQMQFWVETMYDFNAEIARFVKEDLNCPVLVNPGNWKTADVILMEDSERYSQTSGDVIAVNRYFGGLHKGDNNGWAIENGDFYTNPSMLKDAARSFPISVKQVEGKPMMVTESTWVMPTDTGFESSMLLSAYSSLTGFDAYFWFVAQTEGFTPPRSANGYNASQGKWLCQTPDMAGQWPAAALAFRKGYIRRGKPVVQEQRSLGALWQRKSPIIAESASFDPNRDSGDQAPDSTMAGGVDPLAFLVGPVTIAFGGSESENVVMEDLDSYIERTEAGERVTSETGQIILDTDENLFRLDAPQVQSMISYRPTVQELSSVTFESTGPSVSATVVSLDGYPIVASGKLLVQVGTRARPTGWEDEEATVEVSGELVQARKILSYGEAPWRLETAGLKVRIKNLGIQSAHALDANGMPIAEVSLQVEEGVVSFDFPEGTLYVVLEGASGLSYELWKSRFPWETESADALVSADPDGDGAPNLMEFASAGDPLRHDRTSWSDALLKEIDGERALTISFRRNAVMVGVDDSFEYSENLKVWTRVAVTEESSDDRVDLEADGSVETRNLVVQLSHDVDTAFVRRRVEVE